MVDLGAKYLTLVLTIGAAVDNGPAGDAVLIDVRAGSSSTPYFSDRVLLKNAPVHLGPFRVKSAQTLQITASGQLYDQAVIAGTVSS